MFRVLSESLLKRRVCVAEAFTAGRSREFRVTVATKSPGIITCEASKESREAARATMSRIASESSPSRMILRPTPNLLRGCFDQRKDVMAVDCQTLDASFGNHRPPQVSIRNSDSFKADFLK